MTKLFENSTYYHVDAGKLELRSKYKCLSIIELGWKTLEYDYRLRGGWVTVCKNIMFDKIVIINRKFEETLRKTFEKSREPKNG